MEEDNKPLQPTGLLDADAIYVEEVEGEQGLELSLAENQKLNLAGLIKNRFQAAEDARSSHEQAIKTLEDFTENELSLENQKSLEYLLKLQRLKYWQRLVN